jgi:hypothetical protein
MNVHVFRRVCEALVPRLRGARLEKIHALADGVTEWSLYGQGRRFQLILRAARRDPLLFVTDRRVPAGAAPPAFVMRLRKYLAGRKVNAVFAHWIARRLWLRFASKPAGSSPPSPPSSISGSVSVWLCLDLREGPALSWQAPEESGIDPKWPTPAELPALLADPEAWRAWPVLPPALRRVLPLLPAPERAALLADLEAGGGDLFVYESLDGNLELSAWPLPEPLRAGRAETVCDDPLAAADLAGERLLSDFARDAACRAAGPHTAEAARLVRLLAKLDQEEARLLALAARETDALALQAVLYRFAPGEKLASVELETPSGRRGLSLDPRLTVRGNMAALFHQAGRGRRGLALLAGRRESVRAELEAARARALTAGLAPVCAAGQQERVGGGARQGRSGELPKGVQAFRSSDGLFMLRGRDARGNLAALKLARPDDLWLHAEGAPGAHVILRLVPGREPPERSLREAGVLAALKSPFREAGTAKVQCARARHVHPVRGAKPGTVRVDRSEPGLTVRVNPELEVLLAVG